MSVKMPLQAIFSHLYPATDPDALPDADEAADAPAAEPEPEPEPAGEGAEGEEAAEEVEPVVIAEPPPDEYAERISTINGGLADTLSVSHAAADHLTTARKLALSAEIASAKQLDLDHGLEQRRTGLPIGESLLALDTGVLGTHGLLHAKDLLVRVQKAQRARSSDVSTGKDILAEEAASRPPPHYMLYTKGFESNVDSKSALIAGVKSVRALREASRARELDELEKAGKAPPKVDEEARRIARAKADAMMPMEQQERELKVMKRLQAPLDFLRNQRFVLPPRKPAEQAAPEPPAVPRRDTWIHCNPEKVSFVAYDAGGVYEIPVQLHNTSSLSRRVRVLPPSTRYFSNTLLSYQADHGTIAPGMHATFHVRFAPDSLADYDDFIVIQTESESFPLPLHSRRSPPCLTLPQMLQCGHAFAGGETTIDFGAQNTGGAGRFFVMEKAAWDRGEREVQPTLYIGPFEVSPTFLDLQPMDTFTMTVTFRPEVAGPATGRLVLVCDNCQLKELTLAGSGCCVVVNIESVDGQPPLFEQNGAAAQESIDFSDVGVFTEQRSVVRLTNSTPLPLQFEWLRYELPPTMLPLTRQRTVAPSPLISSALGEPLAIGDAIRDLDEASMAQICPFSISPAMGHLPAGEAATFEITFSPLEARLFGGAAILRPIGVPEQALPGYDPTPEDKGDDESNTLEIGLRLLGRGDGWDLKLWPGALLLHGGTTIGTSVSEIVTLDNPNGSVRTWRWDPPSGSHDLVVALDPPYGEVPPGESVDITVHLRGAALGKLKRVLTLSIAPHGRDLLLPVELQVCGPKIEIKSEKLNYGLVPLGDELPRQLTLTFENVSDRDAKWMLCTAPLPAANPSHAPDFVATALAAAKAQAAALGFDYPPPPPAEHGWDWPDRRAQEQLNRALIIEHGATGLRPAKCCGTISAHSVCEVSVTIDAAAEQSMRRFLELRVEHGAPSHVAVRAEVVARAAKMSPFSYAMGTTYVRVPVQRTLTLTNLTQIATTFDCVHHVKEGRASVTIEPPSGTLQPAQTLKLIVTVIAEMAGKLDMLVGCVLHGGTAAPVGCNISAVVQGLTVAYESCAQNDPRLENMPKSLPPPADAVDADGLAVVREPPEVPPLPTIDFGMGVPIFEQRSIVLLVTNLSAVRTRYKLTAKRYPAASLPIELHEPPVPEDYTETATTLAHLKQADLKVRKEAEAEARRARLSGGSQWQIEMAEKAAYEKRGLKPPSEKSDDKKPASRAGSALGGSSTAGGTDAGRSSPGPPPTTGGTAVSNTSRSRRPSIPISFHRPILSNAHERLQPFSSESGVTYSAQQQLRKRELALLDEGHGAAFEITPQEGILEPWGIVAVTCSVHSCLWGLYDDVLTSEVLGLEPVQIPLRAGVVGSPILLHDATLGLSNITSPPTLSWAPVPSGSAPQKKTIRVLNRGPKPAALSWSVLLAPDPTRPLAASIVSAPTTGGGGEGGEEGGEGASTALSLGLGVAPTAPLTDGSFVITPESETIPAGGEKWFQVSFVGAPPNADEADENGNRTFSAMMSATLTHPKPMPIPGGGMSDAHPPLRLALKGHSLEPRLSMSERSKLKFKVSPTLPKEHPAFTRCLTMSNASTSTLEFTLTVPQPFLLAEARCSSAQFKIMGKETVDEGSIFVLPPDSSLQAVINYVPPKKRRRGGASGEGDGADDDTRSVVSTAITTTANSEAGTAADDTDPHISHVSNHEKLLQITYANGSVQTFPLLAVTTTPFVELSAAPVFGTPSVPFGMTHISHTPERSIEMWNPTEAEAKWTITHVPYKAPPAASAAGARAKAALLAGESLPIDDPTVFEFDRREGHLPPRSGMVPERQPLSVKFLPRDAGRYRCTYNLKVRNGMTARLEVTAEATLREEDIDIVASDKHLRLMQLGEVS